MQCFLESSPIGHEYLSTNTSMNIARVLVQTCNLKSMNFNFQSNWNLEWIRAVTGVGAGPAGVVLARPLFC